MFKIENSDDLMNGLFKETKRLPDQLYIDATMNDDLYRDLDRIAKMGSQMIHTLRMFDDNSDDDRIHDLLNAIAAMPSLTDIDLSGMEISSENTLLLEET